MRGVLDCGAAALKPYAVSFPSLRARVLVAVLLLVLKAFVPYMAVSRGLQAKYFAAPEWQEPALSRIDARVSLGREGDPVMAGRSVTWQGYLPARAGVDRQAFYLRGKDVTAELWIDGFQVVHLEPSAREEIQRVAWSAAMHRLIVRMSASPGNPPEFDAGLITTGAMTPFSDDVVLLKPAPAWRVAVDRAAHPLGPWIDVLLAALLAWIAWGVVDFMVPPEEQ